MARNLKLFFDRDGSPRARGPGSEKLLMAFLESDVQGSDHICHDLMDDITAIEDESADSREFIGNAHSVVMTADGVTIECIIDDVADDLANDLANKAADKPSDENAEPNSSAKAPDAASAQAQAASAASNSAAKLASGESAPKAATSNEQTKYQTGLKHFREVLEDWEAFILDDQAPT